MGSGAPWRLPRLRLGNTAQAPRGASRGGGRAVALAQGRTLDLSLRHRVARLAA
jgi:hypothetical protein